MNDVNGRDRTSAVLSPIDDGGVARLRIWQRVREGIAEEQRRRRRRQLAALGAALTATGAAAATLVVRMWS